jgi:aspartate carbamoyltransferase catalytic subunit
MPSKLVSVGMDPVIDAFKKDVDRIIDLAATLREAGRRAHAYRGDRRHSPTCSGECSTRTSSSFSPASYETIETMRRL